MVNAPPTSEVDDQVKVIDPVDRYTALAVRVCVLSFTFVKSNFYANFLI